MAPSSASAYIFDCLEGFGYFADSIALETSQQALLGEISAQDMADEWAEFLTEEYEKYQAAK